MIDPLLATELPDDLVLLGAHREGSGSGAKVVVVGQVYDNVQAQTFLAELCLHLAEQAGVRLVAVEGEDGRVEPGPSDVGVAAPTAAAARETLRPVVASLVAADSQVSAGVLAALRGRPDDLEVWGVDAMDRVAPSQVAMVHVLAGRERRDRALAGLREVVRRAQRAAYPSGLAQIRYAELSIAETRPSLAERADRLRAEAERSGMELAGFPWLRRFVEIRREEKRVRTRTVERQQVRFLERLAEGLFAWARVEGNRVTVDPARLQPVLEYWFEKTGTTRSELDRRVAAAGWEPPLLELRAWIQGWLATSARRAQGAGSHVFQEELMRLALRLGVPFFDLRDFRRSVAMSRDLEALKRTLPDEMAAATRALVERSSARARELWELEERLDWLCRALHLEVPADDAELAGLNESALLEIVEALAGIGGSPIGPDLRVSIAGLEDLLASARTYLAHSWERGRHMAARTVELLEELGEERAVLVAGGFHTRAITRTLEDEPDASWAVLYPQPDLAEVAGRRHYFG